MKIYAAIFITVERDNHIRNLSYSLYRLRYIYNEYYWCPIFHPGYDEILICLKRSYAEQVKIKHTTIDNMMTCFKFKPEDLALPEAE